MGFRRGGSVVRGRLLVTKKMDRVVIAGAEKMGKNKLLMQFHINGEVRKNP